MGCTVVYHLTPLIYLHNLDHTRLIWRIDTYTYDASTLHCATNCQQAYSLRMVAVAHAVIPRLVRHTLVTVVHHPR